MLTSPPDCRPSATPLAWPYFSCWPPIRVPSVISLRCFRFLLERWSLEDVVTQLQTYSTPNCCVLTYLFDQAERRLRLADLNHVHGDWT